MSVLTKKLLEEEKSSKKWQRITEIRNERRDRAFAVVTLSWENLVYIEIFFSMVLYN